MCWEGIGGFTRTAKRCKALPLGHNCLHLIFKPYLSNETYSRKYEKLPNIVIHACKNITEKRPCWKCVACKFGFFTFWLIASKQLNSLTTVVTLSWFGAAEVTHPLWVARGPEFMSRPRQGFLCFMFCCCCCIFTFCTKTRFLTKYCHVFSKVNLYSIVVICGYVPQGAGFYTPYKVTSSSGSARWLFTCR